MAMKAGQAVRCAIVAAAFALGGGAVQAGVIHPIIYDPPNGSGSLQEGDDCTAPSSESCTIDLLTTLVTDSFLNTWELPAPLFDIATGFSFEGGLVAIQTPFFTVNLVSGDGSGSILTFLAAPVSSEVACPTAQLRLNINNTTDLLNDCNVENHGFYEILPAVPEPGSMALILGGAGAAWLVRRRKRAA